MIRKPVQAGRFYSGDPLTLEKEIVEYTKSEVEKKKVCGIIAPHAGYMYSGKTAGIVYGSIKIPDTVIVVGPNHTGMGESLSLFSKGVWETPVGEVEVDSEFAEELLKNSEILCDEIDAHMHEHSIEVQLPFIHVLNKNAKIIPICVREYNAEICRKLGDRIVDAAEQLKKDILIVASSDMTHYESKIEAEKKDRMVIDKILDLDPKGMLDIVEEHYVTMCGAGPAGIMLYAAKKMGAEKAECLKYTTSAEVTKDKDAVVGYAGIIVY